MSRCYLFAMDLWINKEGSKLFSIALRSAAFFVVIKIFVIPFLMIWVAKVLSFTDEAGRAAVLIASIPIFMASFSIGNYYKIGKFP